MMRLVVFGNSHIGALKLAWDEMAGRWPGVSIEFFGLPGALALKPRLFDDRSFGLPEDGSVTAAEIALCRRLNGRTRIGLSQADAALSVGYEWLPQRLAQVIFAFDVDGLVESGAPRLLSAAAFDAVCDALAAEILPDERWSGWSRPSFHAVFRPMPSEVIAADPAHRAWHGIRAKRGVGAAFDRYRRRIAEAMAARGIGAFFQPQDTLSPLHLTRETYGRASVRWASDQPHPEGELFHMNAAFGAKCLDHVLGALMAGAGGTAATAATTRT